MISRRALIAIAAISWAVPLSLGHAQDNKGAVYVVTYVEVAPQAKAETRTMLSALAEASRKETGNSNFDVLQRVDRPQHFLILETWTDAKAQSDHAAAAETSEFREKLKPLLIAPYDERPHFAFAAADTKKTGSRPIYAVTHVDFVGAKKDDGLAALKQLSAESLKEPGNLRFDVLQQTSRPNHVTLVEIWRSKSALETHEQTSHARKFRDDLLPIGGALYDQRLYRTID